MTSLDYFNDIDLLFIKTDESNYTNMNSILTKISDLNKIIKLNKQLMQNYDNHINSFNDYCNIITKINNIYNELIELEKSTTSDGNIIPNISELDKYKANQPLIIHLINYFSTNDIYQIFQKFYYLSDKEKEKYLTKFTKYIEDTNDKYNNVFLNIIKKIKTDLDEFVIILPSDELNDNCSTNDEIFSEFLISKEFIKFNDTFDTIMAYKINDTFSIDIENTFSKINEITPTYIHLLYNCKTLISDDQLAKFDTYLLKLKTAQTFLDNYGYLRDSILNPDKFSEFITKINYLYNYIIYIKNINKNISIYNNNLDDKKIKLNDKINSFIIDLSIESSKYNNSIDENFKTNLLPLLIIIRKNINTLFIYYNYLMNL
jgi:hypothetical protein